MRFRVKHNCHTYAWKQFVDGEAEWICFRKSQYAVLNHHSTKWYWWPARVLGIALQWTGSVLTFLGWYLRWLNWYHAAWVLPGGEWREYVPPGEKRERIIAPLFFHGKEQAVYTEDE